MIASGEAIRSGFDSGPSHGPLGSGQAQVGDREADEARLRLGAAAGRALVADLAARPGGGAGEGRDRGGVVVRLDLHQRVGQLAGVAVAPAHRLGEEALHDRTLHDRGVVGVGAHGARRARALGLADHLEQRAVRGLAVHHPGGVEDLVAAVLGVRLREHRELDVGRVAALGPRPRQQVVDLVRGERQTQRRRSPPRSRPGPGASTSISRERAWAPRGGTARPPPRAPPARVSVIRSWRQGSAGAELARALQVVGGPALDPAHEAEPALAGDVGGLRGPGRDACRAAAPRARSGPSAARRAAGPGRSAAGCSSVARCLVRGGAVDLREVPVAGGRHAPGREPKPRAPRSTSRGGNRTARRRPAASGSPCAPHSIAASR